MKPEILFTRRGSLRDFLDQQKSAIKIKIDSEDSNYILNVSEEDYCQYLLKEFMLEPPELDIQNMYINDQRESDIDVSQDHNRVIRNRNEPFYLKGIRIEIAVPYTGNRGLFHFQTSMFTTSPPMGMIGDNEVGLVYETLEHNPEHLKKDYQRDINEINRWLGFVKNEVDPFNDSLEPFIKQYLQHRKQKLLKDQSMVQALGLPIKKRDNLPETYPVPVNRRKVKIAKPNAPTDPYYPEPALDGKVYEEILETIQNMALVMERSPETFKKLSEEEIRDHFLMNLNATFEGKATGETFNNIGKTDILIRDNNKNVFIAECKIWRGQKQLSETIDQLLGYTSWRDTKTAILIFNKNRNLTAVLQKIDPTMKSHQCFKRDHKLKNTKINPETTFSYTYHHPNDSNKELKLTITVFDIPK